ncbi:hypothetical protein J7426_04540 [Tropicibacter sp. R16_0]|uniref:hypothetical protein n=1 Tax=Tropicibacter sp. R16_0 TaxID=2821102 RepID=UPI001ADCE975|nr:hypothetical protein [Tropicibacter sp. R16_0]MBO9449512.1 hypothetical protein [Tropicibacter sp. R16_0]
MKKALGFLTLAMVLGACAGPLDVYYKPGATVARLQTDQTQCEVKALKDAPVANEIRQRPPIYYPGYPICDGYGNCWYRPGFWADGGVYSVDVNKDLRNRVLTQCMAGKGYNPVSIPQCSAGVKANAPVARTTTLPKLTGTSCYIKNDDGSYQIVSQVASQ